MSSSKKAAVTHSLSGRGRKPDSSKYDTKATAYKCTRCRCTFDRKSALTIHWLRQHPTDKPHKCDTCNCKFMQKSALKLHMIVTHHVQPEYLCRLCGATFNLRVSLTIHMGIHRGERPFKCDVCKRRFVQKGNLKTHMRLHTGERPYKCSECGQTFTQLSNLQTHIFYTHSVAKTGETLYNLHYSQVKKRCQQCSAVFSCESALIRHVVLQHSSSRGLKTRSLKKREPLPPKRVQNVSRNSKPKNSRQRKERKTQFQRHSNLEVKSLRSRKVLELDQNRDFYKKKRVNRKSQRKSERNKAIRTPSATGNLRNTCFEDKSLRNDGQNNNAAQNTRKSKTAVTSSMLKCHSKPRHQSNHGESRLNNITTTPHKLPVQKHKSCGSPDSKPSGNNYALKYEQCDEAWNVKKENGTKGEKGSKAVANELRTLQAKFNRPSPKYGNVTSVESFPYQCTSCGADFKQHDDMWNHLCTNDRRSSKTILDTGRTNTSTSPESKTICNMQSALKNFVQSHGYEKIEPYKCKLCNVVYYDAGLMSIHIRNTHGSPSNLQEALKTPLRVNELHNIYSSKFVMYKCDQCSAEFELRCHLLNHVRLRHRSAMIVKLPNDSTIRKSELKLPATLKDGKASQSRNNKTFKCKECDGKYSSKSTLLRHYKYRHASFDRHTRGDSKSSIKRALPQKSSTNYRGRKLAPYKCEQCNCEYVYFRCLVNHIKMKHQITKWQLMPSLLKKSKNLVTAKSEMKLKRSRKMKSEHMESFIDNNHLHNSVDCLPTTNSPNEIGKNEESSAGGLGKCEWESQTLEYDDELTVFPIQCDVLKTATKQGKESPEDVLDLSLEQRSSYDELKEEAKPLPILLCDGIDDAIDGERSLCDQFKDVDILKKLLQCEREDKTHDQTFTHELVQVKSQDVSQQYDRINDPLIAQKFPLSQLSDEVNPLQNSLQCKGVNDTAALQQSPYNQFEEVIEPVQTLLQCERTHAAANDQTFPFDKLKGEIKPLSVLLQSDGILDVTKAHEKCDTQNTAHSCSDVTDLHPYAVANDYCGDLGHLLTLQDTESTSSNYDVSRLSPSQKQSYLEQIYTQTVSTTNRISYSCDQCGIRFWHQRSMMRHNRINHVGKKGKKPETSEDLERKREQIAYSVIKSCSPDLLNSGIQNLRELVDRELLIQNYTVSSGEVKTLPHVCGNCTGVFESKKDFHVHLLTHAAERG